MKFRREQSDRVLVVGIFHGAEMARALWKKLRGSGFRRVAVVRPSERGRARVEEHFVPALRMAAVGSAIGATVGVFAISLQETKPGELILFFLAFALVGAGGGWILARLLRERVDPIRLARCANTILPEEAMVVADVKVSETSRLLLGITRRRSGAGCNLRFSFVAPVLIRCQRTNAWSGATRQPASRGKCGESRPIHFGQPGNAATRAFLSEPAARGRAGTGMGKRESHDVGRCAPRLYSFGRMAA